jgi:hypothetical protein
MTKAEMALTLRCVGCNENTITAMENAFEMGFEAARDQARLLAQAFDDALVTEIENLKP